MGQDYIARKTAKKQRKRDARNAEMPGRANKRKQRGKDGLDVVGEDEGLLAPADVKRQRKKGNNVSLRISRSLCYKEPQITEEDKNWDGSWEGGAAAAAAAEGVPSLAGMARSGYDSDVEEQLQQLPLQQRQQQQRLAKPKQQQQQQQQVVKPKMSTGIGLLDPAKAAQQQQQRRQQQQQQLRQQQHHQLDEVVSASPALATLSKTLNPLLARCMANLGYLEPTPVQQAAWQPAVSGSDVQGVAEPGSGKTLAYLLPLLTQLADVAPQAAAAAAAAADAAGCSSSNSEAAAVRPQGLILAPSRELAQQVHAVAASLAGVTGISSSCVFGGVPKQQQAEQLTGLQPQLLVATPGRLLELIGDGLIGLGSVQVVVLDEADKMLSVGFEPQLQLLKGMLLSDRQGGGRSAADAASSSGTKQKKKRKQADSAAAVGPGVGQPQQQQRRRPQVLLFTATLPAAVQATADAWLLPGAVRVSCTAGADSISRTITQVVHVCAEHKKPAKLLKHLAAIKAAAAGLRNPPRVLVFANKIKTVLFIHRTLQAEGLRVVMLHGKRSQAERNAAVADFKSGKAQVLVASDVASRGLDIRGLPYVVQYDFPGNLETYVHRVGRTGRLAAQGHAYSFFTRSLARLAGPVAELLQAHGQAVDPNLLALGEAWQQAEAALAAQGKSVAELAGAAAGIDDEEDEEQEGAAGGQLAAAQQVTPPEDLQEGLPKPKKQQGGAAGTAAAAAVASKQQQQQQHLEQEGEPMLASIRKKRKAKHQGDMLMVPQATAAEGGCANGSADAGAAAGTAAAAAEFLPSKSFVGARPGMVFKKGPRGLGYYADAAVAAAAARKQQLAAKLAAKQQQQQQQQQQPKKKKAAAQQQVKAPALPMLPGLAMKMKRHAFFAADLSRDDGGDVLDGAVAGGGSGSGVNDSGGSEDEGEGRAGSFAARLQQQQQQQQEGQQGAAGKRKALPGRLRRKLAGQKAAQAAAAAAGGKKGGSRSKPAGKQGRPGK